MKTSKPFLAIPLLLAAWSAFGAGGGSMPSGGSSDFRPNEPPRPEEQARTAYNAGVRAVEKAEAQSADAARQADPRKQQKANDKARNGYAAALKKFTRATELHPVMHEAWNYVGYTQRKLGNYDAALAAYERALTLKPGYAEAIEYRGHAYLGLNRIVEAKEAYLTLYSGNRALADKLLVAMREWIGTRRGAAGVDPVVIDAFASWVDERGTIARQTAGLTRAGARAGWR
ncbi:MAG: tetratricopeptide repeat protein [Steroidobacteraceae bacterium]|nr:tetratricopeptide repeat protein [Steroidobacteraceae bacterium]